MSGSTSSHGTGHVPKAFAAVYDELRHEVQWLHGRWLTYRELYAVSPKRIELLNACAPMFFYFLQEVLVDEVQVALSKLTDPARNAGHDNLSFCQLQKQVDEHGDSILAGTCRETLKTLQAQCEAFRLRRNKRLAHLDLATSLGTAPEPLPDVSGQMIEDALSSVRRYLNAIELHYNDSEWGYEHIILPEGADALVAILRDGLRYRELVQERALPWDDWRKGNWTDL